MCELQGSFGWLQTPLGVEDMDQQVDLIEKCFWLHKLQTQLVGINKSGTFMSPSGARVLVKGCGKVLRKFCSLTVGNTTMSACFMFKKSGIEALVYLHGRPN